jgi:hypothetical protein
VTAGGIATSKAASRQGYATIEGGIPGNDFYQKKVVSPAFGRDPPHIDRQNLFFILSWLFPPNGCRRSSNLDSEW